MNTASTSSPRGASVAGSSVRALAVGAGVGRGDGGCVGLGVVGFRVGLGVVGFRVGFDVAGGAGRQLVNAMQVHPLEQSVSWPVMQGSWHFCASDQLVPHQ